MKARVPLNKKQEDEIFRVSRKFIKEGMETVQEDVDCLWLMTLRETFGFGEKRLRRLYKRLYEVRQEYMTYYESDGYDGLVEIAARRDLRNIGIDIAELKKDKPVLVDTTFSRTVEEDKKRFRRRNHV